MRILFLILLISLIYLSCKLYFDIQYENKHKNDFEIFKENIKNYTNKIKNCSECIFYQDLIEGKNIFIAEYCYLKENKLENLGIKETLVAIDKNINSIDEIRFLSKSFEHLKNCNTSIKHMNENELLKLNGYDIEIYSCIFNIMENIDKTPKHIKLMNEFLKEFDLLSSYSKSIIDVDIIIVLSEYIENLSIFIEKLKNIDDEAKCIEISKTYQSLKDFNENILMFNNNEKEISKEIILQKIDILNNLILGD